VGDEEWEGLSEQQPPDTPVPQDRVAITNSIGKYCPKKSGGLSGVVVSLGDEISLELAIYIAHFFKNKQEFYACSVLATGHFQVVKMRCREMGF
jgi:hypothetical protein